MNLVPQSEFAGIHKGAENIYFGVPQRDPSLIHHFRSGKCITNIEKLLESELTVAREKFDGTWLYLGPFDYHYGHFISECLGRTWASVNHNFDGLIWLPTFHPSEGFNWVRKLPSWQSSILSYLGIGNKDQYFLTETGRVSKLIVPESGCWLNTRPSNNMLDFLRVRQNEYFKDKIAESANVKKNLVIARSPKFLGQIKNIEVLHLALARHGYEIVFPELLSFDEQMNLYRNAENLIFEEGSALHTLELFASLQAQVAIIPRSLPGIAAFKIILNKRVKKIVGYDGKVEVLNNRNLPRFRDISINFSEVVNWLHQEEFI